MIVGTSKNYTFRKVDLSIFPDLASPNDPVEARLGINQVIGGQSRASQNFLKALMTPLGHYRSDPGYGSEFTSRVLVGGVVYPEDLPNIFAIEALRVIEFLIGVQSGNPNDDEVIERAELSDYSVGRGTVLLTIQLSFRNSASPKQILLPVQLSST